MKEAFEILLMKFCFLGLGGIAVLAFVKAIWPSVSRQIGEPIREAVRKCRISILIPISCVCGLIGYASNKQNVQTNEPAAGVRSIAAGTTLHLIEPWFRRGGCDTGHILTFDEDWCFPHGTNHLARVELWGSGAVYPSEQDPSPVARLATRLLLKANMTRVSCGRTTNNTYRIEWRDAFVSRTSNETIDAFIELFRNGDVIVTENGVTTEMPYEIPFEHDGYGQDDDWVRSNFTRLQQVSPSLANAEEVISIGYANWVDQQVGVGITNGLYKFTARFEDDPPEPTQLYIGDYSVCVTNAGEYSFVLEKGIEYTFGTWPFNDEVDYFAEDDLAPQRSLRTVFGRDPAADDAVWTKDNEICDLWRPWRHGVGYLFWLPSFQGSPDILDGDLLTFPITVHVQFDYPHADRLTYYWSCSDANVEFVDPHSQTTEVRCPTLPRWGECELTVSTFVAGYELRSTLRALYGTDGAHVAGVSCHCPEYIDTYRPGESLSPVTLIFNSTVPTNGLIRATGWHYAGARLYFDRHGMDEVPERYEAELFDVEHWSKTFYLSCPYPSESIGQEAVACLFLDGQEGASHDVRICNFTVVDRLVEPILSRAVPDSSPQTYYNPCCASPNSVIHLCASVEPISIPGEQIVWYCVSGGATFVSGNQGRDVSVRMGNEDAVFEVSTAGLLPSSRKIQLTVRVIQED